LPMTMNPWLWSHSSSISSREQTTYSLTATSVDSSENSSTIEGSKSKEKLKRKKLVLSKGDPSEGLMPRMRTNLSEEIFSVVKQIEEEESEEWLFQIL